MSFTKRSYRIFHIAVVLFLLMGSGIHPAFAQEAQAPVPQQTPTVKAPSAPQGQNPEHEDDEFLQLYKTIQRIIDAIAIDAVPTDKEFRYAVAKGMMRALKDPYADFFTPEETKYTQEQMQGSFAGIGATMRPEGTAALEVVALVPDAPAQKAGLQKDDRIVAIDGVAVSEYTYFIAIMHIRGVAGTTVKLTVLRKGLEVPLEFNIIRETVAIPDAHVTARLDGAIGIITIPQFGDTTADEFYSAVTELFAAGANAFIINLRNNGGGKLDTAIEIASAWAEDAKRPVTILQTKNGMQRYPPMPVALLHKFKTVVLINGASASASEILAGALRDWGAATLIGTTTYGKGVAQSVIPFSDGSSLRITSAYWLTPKGERIHGKGIKPDIVVELTPENAKAKKDPQIDRALEFLKTGK